MARATRQTKVMMVLVAMAMLCTAGCSAKDESETVAILQSALSDLQANRSLAEQFVRDVKESVPPTDPNYQQALDSYENARDAYNHYLDTVENSNSQHSSRSLRSVEATNAARSTTAEFLADATTALRPSVATRHVEFQRAIVLPDNLQRTLKKLPKSSRDYLTDKFDDQVRWRSWGQL